MIGKLTGITDWIGQDELILDVGGVGYQLFVSKRALQSLEVGTSAQFYTELLVRDDQIRMIGFHDRAEQRCYHLLCSVQGVGQRLALLILSTLSPAQLATAIAASDARLLTSISGVGNKLAQRLIGELREAMGKANFAISDKITEAGLQVSDADEGGQISNRVGDAVAALTKLGCHQPQAVTVVSRLAEQNPKLDLAGLIRLGLGELFRK